MRFYFGQNDNSFCSKEGNLVLLEQNLFLQISFSVIGAHIFILPIFQFLSQKLKGRRIKRKKKIEKIKKKKRQNFLHFFQLFLSFFSPKRNSKGKKRRKNHSPLLSHFLPQNRKKEEKEGEKKQKKRKKRRKRKIFSTFFNSHSFLPKRKIKRKKREGKRKKNGRKYARLQGHEKEKDLVHLEMNKV